MSEAIRFCVPPRRLEQQRTRIPIPQTRMRADVAASPHCVDPVASGPGRAELPSRRVRDWKRPTGRPFPFSGRSGEPSEDSALPIPFGPLHGFDTASSYPPSSQTARKPRRCPAGAFPRKPKLPCSELLRGSHQRRSTGRSLSDPAPFDPGLATSVSLCPIGRQVREILANLWSLPGLLYEAATLAIAWGKPAASA